MEAQNHSLLIVEDDVDLAEMLNAYFRSQGYQVTVAHWGEDALQACASLHPALIILDIRLPDMDGYEVARRLRENRRTHNIPIIFLTDRRSRADRLQGLELGADDYITKPFDMQELRLRVRNSLQRFSKGSLVNPVTELPEGNSVDERLQSILAKDEWGLIIASLNNLDSFREAYGFVASDDVLRAFAVLVSNVIKESGFGDTFLAQIGPSDLLLAVEPQRLSELEGQIRSRIEQSLDYFYPLKDRDQPGASSKRLAIRTGRLTASAGPFASIDKIKTALLRTRA